jgi:hypothetical protein
MAVSIGYIIGALIALGWVWLVPIAAGIAGFHYKLNAIDTTLIGSVVSVIVFCFYFYGFDIGYMLETFMSATFLGIPDPVLAIFTFLIGGGITYITYYVLSAISGGKEKD